MACLNPNGELTESARKILSAMEGAAALTQVAGATGFPLYRIRSAARELAAAGLVAEAGEIWQLTAAGRTAMQKLLPAA